MRPAEPGFGGETPHLTRSEPGSSGRFALFRGATRSVAVSTDRGFTLSRSRPAAAPGSRGRSRTLCNNPTGGKATCYIRLLRAAETAENTPLAGPGRLLTPSRVGYVPCGDTKGIHLYVRGVWY